MWGGNGVGDTVWSGDGVDVKYICCAMVIERAVVNTSGEDSELVLQ